MDRTANSIQTKLTLRLDERLIRQAKRHARRRGSSLSRLVADYFKVLGETPESDECPLPPLTRRLRGSLRGRNVEEDDYGRYLVEKYR